MDSVLFRLRNVTQHNQGTAHMYKLDFATCTMDEVIARSLICHPSLLRHEALEAARIHTQAAKDMRDGAAKRSALDMARAAQRIASIANSGGCASDLSDDFGARVIAFARAAKLQLIPRATQNEICDREDKRAAFDPTCVLCETGEEHEH